MTLHLPDLVYDCVGCGRSCTDFGVELMPSEVQPLQDSPVTAEVRAQGYEPLRMVDSGRAFLAKKPDSTCVYLSPEVRCRIHSAQGFAAKPFTCQTFPFGAEPTPDGVYLGLSFACTAVVRQLGRPLTAQRAELEPRYAGDSFEGDWRLWQDAPLDWARYRDIEARMLAGLTGGFDLGLLQAAAALCVVVKTGDWDRLAPEPGLSPAFGAAADGLLGGLITLMETAGDPPERVEQVLRTFSAGGTYFSNVLEREVAIGALDWGLPEWYPARTTLYLEHLLFRKTLLKPPDVLSRACLLPLVAHAVRYFTVAAAAGAPAREEHWERAVGILEGRLMFHARGMESYFQRIAQGFLEATQV